MADAIEADADVIMPDKTASQPHPIQSNTYNNNDDDDTKEKPLPQLDNITNDTEQAQINAFIHDEDESTTSNAKTSTESNHGLFNRIGQIFKKKKKIKSVPKSSQSHHNDNNNNNNNTLVSQLASSQAFTTAMQAQLNENNNEERMMTDLVGGDTPWNCEKCTFLNEATELHCVVCFYSRFEVKNLAAQWQWKAADRWITYGIPETTEIENAYKNGAKEISLSKGWFASNPNLYCIYFDKEYGNKKHQKIKGNVNRQHEFDEASTYFYQINKDTSTRREVRRIASDDDNLFKKLSLNELDEKDRKCMICLHEFSVKDEANQLIVQLSTCKNHGFHKECIVQWVQLKGNCPLCRIDVDT